MNTLRMFVLTCFLFSAPAALKAQDILAEIPDIPQDACSADKKTRYNFEEQVSGLISKINVNIRGLKQSSRPDEAKGREQAEQMLLQQGLTPEEVGKMKDKNLTREEKQALADRMMQQYANMSMAEANQMKTMTAEGKQAYAEAYAAEAQAAAQAGGKDKQNAQPANKNYTNLLLERNDQYQKILSGQKAIMHNYQLVDEDAEGLRMAGEMKNLMAEMNRLVGGGGEGGWNVEDKKVYDADKLALNNLRKQYCEHMSVKYRNALSKHLSDLHSVYGEYLKLEETSGRVDNTIVSTGSESAVGRISYLEWVIEYLEKLKDVYRYFPNED